MYNSYYIKKKGGSLTLIHYRKIITTFIVLLFIGITFNRSSSHDINISNIEEISNNNIYFKSYFKYSYVSELPAFRENIDEFIKTEFQNTTNCDCEYTTVRRFPILCQILLPIALLYYYLITVYYDYDPPRIILQQYAMFKAMAESWSCWWIWWETIN
jgi:hypothetical protein